MNEIKYLDLEGLQRYDNLIKKLIDEKNIILQNEINNDFQWGELGSQSVEKKGE